MSCFFSHKSAPLCKHVLRLASFHTCQTPSPRAVPSRIWFNGRYYARTYDTDYRVGEALGSGRSVVVYLYAAENSGTLSRSAMQERNWNMGGCNCSKISIECASEGQCDCTLDWFTFYFLSKKA